MPCSETTHIMVHFDKFSEGNPLSISSFISLNLAKREIFKIRVMILSPLCEITFGQPLFLLCSTEPVFSCFCIILYAVDFMQPTFFGNFSK